MKAIWLIGACACGALLEAGCGTVRRCNEEAGVANVEGEWLLDAEGEWKNCSLDGIEDGDLVMDAEVTLPVVQSSTASGEESLSLAEPVESPDSTVTFAGTVRGSCIDFTVTEAGTGYTLTYAFEGAIDGDEIRGGFTGSAEGCDLEGDFEVKIYATSRPHPYDGAGGGDPHAGSGDAGGDVNGDSRLAGDEAGRSRSCHTTSDCSIGLCQSGQCVAVCETATDCSVGQTCTDGRCEEAEGCACACSALGGPWFLLVVVAFWALVARRRKR